MMFQLQLLQTGRPSGAMFMYGNFKRTRSGKARLATTLLNAVKGFV